MKTFEEYLTVLLTKELHELNAGELAFLKARRDYLTPQQIEKYQLAVVVDIHNTKVPYGRSQKTNPRRT